MSRRVAERRVAARRLGGASSEIAAAGSNDHMVVNDDLERAISEVMQIIQDAPRIDAELDNRHQDNVGDR
jgi:guanylate kinase